MFCRHMAGKHNALTEQSDKPVMSFDWRGYLSDAESKQGCMSRIEHRVIGSATSAVRVAGVQKQARAGKRGLGLGDVVF